MYFNDFCTFVVCYCWQVRPLLQEIISESVSKSKCILSGNNESEMADQISKAAVLEQEIKSARTMSHGMRNLNLWFKEATAMCVEGWLRVNGGLKSFTSQVAYQAVVSKLMSRMCNCKRKTTTGITKSKVDVECPVHDIGVCLADLIWWTADCIFENVPLAVPSVPFSFATKYGEYLQKTKNNASTDPFDIPAFMHFICKAEIVKDSGLFLGYEMCSRVLDVYSLQLEL